MEVRIVGPDGADDAGGTVVVIDVLRAFTTAAVAFAAGVRRIHAVGEVGHAFALHDELRGRGEDALLAGEDGGLPIEGFDLDNSPAGLRARLRDGLHLHGRVLVQRTSAGTRGLVRARRADHLLAASFACAGATARHVDALGCPATLVVTGASPAGSRSPFPDAPRDGDEDHACAEYLVALLRGGQPDPGPYLERVATSTAGRWFADPEVPDYPVEDLAVARELDVLDRALVAGRDDDGGVILTPR